MSIPRARRLRKNANLPEDRAWAMLRGLRRHGFPVRRQHPIGRDIVDFAILRARLVIEIDGSIHSRADVAQRDAEREARLLAQGWRVLRLSAAEALSPDALMGKVLRALGLLEG